MTFMYSANKPLLVSRTAALSATGNALRAFVGRGKPYSVKELSNQTGVPDRQIECAMCHPESTDHRRLKDEELLSIALFLGPKFTTEMLKPANQAAYSIEPIELVEPGEIVAGCATDTAEVASRAADGHFDTHDRRALVEVGQRHVERGRMLVAMGALA